MSRKAKKQKETNLPIKLRTGSKVVGYRFSHGPNTITIGSLRIPDKIDTMNPQVVIEFTNSGDVYDLADGLLRLARSMRIGEESSKTRVEGA